METKLTAPETKPRSNPGLLVTDGRIVACRVFAEAARELNRAQLEQLLDLWRDCATDSLWSYHHHRLRSAIDMVKAELSRRPDAV